MRMIPLRSRSGEVVAEARVDDDDYLVVGQMRWHLHDRYVVHTRKEAGQHVMVRLHRLLLGLESGDPRLGEHIDRNPLNNCRSNLRVVAGNAENAQNRHPLNGNGTSRYRGVSWKARNKKWVAQGEVNGRKVHLGLFTDEAEAARAAAAWRAEHHPYAFEDIVARYPKEES